MHPANERWRYNVMSSFIGWAHSENDPCCRGAPLEVQNGTQQDLNKMIDLVNFGGKKIVYMLKMGDFEMGPNKIWIKW